MRHKLGVLRLRTLELINERMQTADEKLGLRYIEESLEA